jgi:hypothetical protein
VAQKHANTLEPPSLIATSIMVCFINLISTVIGYLNNLSCYHHILRSQKEICYFFDVATLRYRRWIPSYFANPSYQARSALIPLRSDLSFAGSRISQRNDQMSSSDTTTPNCLTNRARPLQSSSMLRSREPSSCPTPPPAPTRSFATLSTSLVM